MVETPEFDTRRSIFLLLSKHPGLNLSSIANQLEMSIPLAVYHLNYLEKQEIITATKDTGYKRFFIKNQVGVQTKKMLSIFRQQTSLEIVLFLLQHPYSPHKEILEQFTLSKSTLSYHLKKLVDHEIISEQTDRDHQGYKVINETAVIQFLLKYPPSPILKRFNDIWANLSVQKK